jgi:protein-tyrosine phosphatase
MAQMTGNPAILTVCTGNLCRSPVLERLLRLGFARHWPAALVELPIASAGTHALVGHSIPDPLMTRLASIGAESSRFASQQLTRQLLVGTSLVITLTREHRAAVVELYPPAVRLTFTLRELARLSAALPAGGHAPLDPRERLAAFAAALAAGRGLAAPTDPADDDVIDPYRGSDARYQEAWVDLVAGASAMLRALVPVQHAERIPATQATGTSNHAAPDPSDGQAVPVGPTA